ncbi:Thioredoxin domain-containing protein 9 [Seminavis robusta]|uniref:Thioredoxin domain-containing protein 9 n=1 Tax=Seminavis robusta TaxID=568900 RepID=A0A9N8HHS9_9STRA|nr:Thioredoxin domain-containing protein 9 [Seminavis robusta]|eukprot:Sro463_g148150.1 Thioredoxin domain-containing protein 9 (254) ;mRNA; f:17024-17785
MDLGFGASNQKVGNAAANMMLQTAQAQEQAIVDEMAAYDALLEDDDALELLRQKRLQQMKQEAKNRQKWRAQGHGEYTELAGSDVNREFFEASKESNRLVVHFYRPETPLCDHFHAALAKLATTHLETRFLKINVGGCDQSSGGAASYLVEKLGIIVMPTLIIVKDRKVVHHIRGCDELGDNPEFSTNALEYVLGIHDGVHHNPDDEIPPELLHVQGVNAIRIRGASRKNNNNSSGNIRDGVSSGSYHQEDFD